MKSATEDSQRVCKQVRVKSGRRGWGKEAILDFGRATFGDDEERIGRLKPEQKVDMTVDMSEACVRVCAEGIKSQNPSITEGELIEKLRERFEWGKSWQKRRRLEV
jgi:hypothetical protein